jgi:hypothetical protein
VNSFAEWAAIVAVIVLRLAQLAMMGAVVWVLFK